MDGYTYDGQNLTYTKVMGEHNPRNYMFWFIIPFILGIFAMVISFALDNRWG